MDSRRLLLALVLSAGLFYLVQKFVPGGAPASKPNADSLAVAKKNASGATASSATSSSAASNAATSTHGAAATDSTHLTAATPVAPAIRPETTVIMSRPDSGVRYAMSNVGAAPVSVVMNAFESRSKASGKVDLATHGQSVIKYQLVTNKSAPLDLSHVPFTVAGSGNVLTYQAVVAGATVAIRYTFAPDSYAVHVSGSVTPSGTGDGNYMLVDLPSTFTATEADTNDDRNSLAYTYYTKRDGAKNITFRSLDPGEKSLASGPLQWVAAKSKYFAVGLLAPKGGTPFAEATLVGGARTSKVATNASATVVVPMNNGAFAFDLYTGPQSLKRLQAQGRDFEELNPYGWAIFHSILQPLAIGVTRLVLWMHERLALSYGVVLVILGVLIRLLMWPLNQSSLRTSMKMQALQPELQRVQEKYKQDPEKQRTEIMKVYSEHGMSPLSPILGCLPALLPWPFLAIFFFVFRSTIEFRGVPFLWLHDLSAHDPYYILPLTMALVAFLTSWISMRNMPPNPQAKMMSYMMPVMLLALLGRAAAGLNVYYTMQSLAGLPQQWFIARERQRVGVKPAAKPAAKPVASASSSPSSAARKKKPS